MTPGLLMAIAGGLLAVSILALIVNFSTIWNNPSRLREGGSMGRHLLFGALTSISGFALLAGFVWFLIATYT